MKLLAYVMDICAMFCFCYGALVAYEKKGCKAKELVIRGLTAAWAGGAVRDAGLCLLCGALVPFAILTSPDCWVGCLLALLLFFHPGVRKQRLFNSGLTDWLICIGDGVGSGAFLVSGGLKALDCGLGHKAAIFAGFFSAAGAGIVNILATRESGKGHRLVKKTSSLLLWLTTAFAFSKAANTADQRWLSILFAECGGVIAAITKVMNSGNTAKAPRIKSRNVDSFKIGLDISGGYRFSHSKRSGLVSRILRVYSAMYGSKECLMSIAIA